MKKIFLTLTTLMFFITSNVYAHGPSRQTSVFTAEVNVNADEIWAVIQDFSDMSWHPSVASVDDVKGGNKKGGTRTFTLKSGGQVTDVIKKHDAKKKLLKFKTPTDKMTVVKTIEHDAKENPIRSFPASNQVSQIKIESVDANTAKILWKSSYFRGYMNNLYPDELPELNQGAANTAIQNYIKAGILGLLQKFDKNAQKTAIKLCVPAPPEKDCPF